MATLMETLTRQLGGAAMQRMSGRLGADEGTTEKAVQAALPMLLGALAKNAGTQDGAASLHRALEKDHDGSVLDNLTGAIDQPDERAANGILGHLLGNRRQAVEQGVGQTSGLSGQQAGQMMTMLAPMVMGALGKARNQGGLDAGALTSMLGGERQAISKSAGALGGLMGLLDSDGDGQVMDDVAGKLGKGLLGGLFGRK